MAVDVKSKYESSLAERFLEETYGKSVAGEFVLVERPDLPPSSGGCDPQPGGWPDFVYRHSQRTRRLVLELGRLNEGDQELWFERRVERFGANLRERLKGRLPRFYVLQLPYELQLPRGKGKIKATEELITSLSRAITDAATSGIGVFLLQTQTEGA